ncbi:hypothetical protein NSP_5120 [Nodularia spumigena CCY9414]|nr:hypothetical protein NSP_5120 [Nodularia spumigena CCY9414]
MLIKISGNKFISLSPKTSNVLAGNKTHYRYLSHFMGVTC